MGRRATDDGAFLFVSEGNGGIPSGAMPCACGERTFCGDLNIRIDAFGGWHYNASPIARKEMVRLFASMLVVGDEGHHWLVTPTEMGRIEVEDAPFIALDLYATGNGEDQVLCLCTNVDDLVCVGKDTPITIKRSPANGSMTAYVAIGDGLEAKIDLAAYDQLVELGVTLDVDGHRVFGVWSSGTFFVLNPTDDNTA